MELSIISPAYYKTTRPFKYLLASADRVDINFRYYGFGQDYKDWIQTHIDDCYEQVKWAVNTSHVMFVDAVDVLFLKSAKEIIQRYMMLGHPPMLVACEKEGMNAGCWLGERDVAVAMLEHLKTLKDIPRAGDPQERWRYALSCGDIEVFHDASEKIFAVNQWPTDACVLHLAGGYCDPVTGREERLLPIWEEITKEITK
jgi:hypothetical protein